MPSPRGALGVTSLNEKIYAIGGGTNFIPRDNLEAYDPKTNSWIKLRPMPTPREHLAVATAGGLIFALGGYQKTRFNNLITNEAYDPKTDTWEKRVPLPYPVSGFTAVGINKSIFIFGGEQGWAVSGEVYEYRLDKDRWYRRANMPVPRYAAAASVLKNNHIHIMGGNSLLGGYLFNLDHDIFIP